MQKLDFVNSLEAIVEDLKSREIVQLFKTGFAQPTVAGRYDLITPLLFLSKSNYDKLKEEPQFSYILSSLDADTVFSEHILSKLTGILHQVKAVDIFSRADALTLYDFHNTLLNTLKLSKDVLTSKAIQQTVSESIEDGIVIFQIVIEGEGLETEKYIKIFVALQELVSTISKIVKETEQKSEIILLDSGSDTNVGIKAGIETARSLFLIFKEVWDFIISYRQYKQKQNNQTLLESLTLRGEIMQKVQEGILTEDEAKEYIHMIKTRTDHLIGMKVLPKQIALEQNSIDNKKLLQQFDGFKLLTEGDGV